MFASSPSQPSFNLSVAAVLLAGGKGTRLQSIVSDVPKPMAPVQGLPFLDWIFQFLDAHGLKDIYLSTGYLGELIEDYCNEQRGRFNALECLREQSPLGTAGGFLNVTKSHACPPDIWVVLNADTLFLVDLPQIIEEFARSSSRFGIVASREAKSGRYGVLEINDLGKLTAFKEKEGADNEALINGGIYLVKQSLIDRYQKEVFCSFEEDLIAKLLRESADIDVYERKAPFIDIGIPESYIAANKFIQDNKSYFNPTLRSEPIS